MSGDSEAKRGGVSSKVYMEFLEDVIPIMWEPDLVFMQDNAGIHRARIVTVFFEEHGIGVLEWPPYSPDLNPIEHAWHRLKERVYELHPELLEEKGKREDVKQAMLNALSEAWDTLKDTFFTALIESMQRRVKAVVDAEGWYTKY